MYIKLPKITTFCNVIQFGFIWNVIIPPHSEELIFPSRKIFSAISIYFIMPCIVPKTLCSAPLSPFQLCTSFCTSIRLIKRVNSNIPFADCSESPSKDLSIKRRPLTPPWSHLTLRVTGRNDWNGSCKAIMETESGGKWIIESCSVGSEMHCTLHLSVCFQ